MREKSAQLMNKSGVVINVRGVVHAPASSLRCHRTADGSVCCQVRMTDRPARVLRFGVCVPAPAPVSTARSSGSGTGTGVSADVRPLAQHASETRYQMAPQRRNEGPCPPGHSCTARAPDGWQGPVVRSPVAPGEDAPPCTDPWQAELAFFDDYVEPGPTRCTCECVVELAELCYAGVWWHDESQACDILSSSCSMRRVALLSNQPRVV